MTMGPSRFIPMRIENAFIQQPIIPIPFTNQTTAKRLRPNLPCVISVGIMQGN